MQTCENKSAFRYTWPGRDESFVCAGHSMKLQTVAAVIALPLQLIPHKGETCRQEVSGKQCFTCAGCGLIANDDERSPWKYWADLESPANMMVVIGIVKPEPCPDCHGDCYV